VELVLNPKACCLQVAPVKSQLSNAAEQMQVTLAPHSFTAFDLALAEPKLVAEI
jgi:alpha-L-arabinofuranosidase